MCFTVARTLMFEVDGIARYQITLPVGVIETENYKALNIISTVKFDKIRDEYPGNIEFYGYMSGKLLIFTTKTFHFTLADLHPCLFSPTAWPGCCYCKHSISRA